VGLSNFANSMSGFFRRLRMLVHRERFRSELDEEMAFHREEQQREFEAAGMAPAQARRAARRRFGNEQRLHEQSHEVVGFRLESVWQDARYAVRQMLRAPGFTLAVVLTLALGIGANTAIFSVVRGTLLRALPYPKTEQIVNIKDVRIKGASTGGLVSVPRVFDLEARSQSFESLACFYFEHPTLIAGTHLPEHMNGVSVTGQFWRVFGARPMLGRVFNEREDRPNTAEVVVLSYAAWQRLFGGDPEAIGRVVSIDKQSATIVGVMPRNFEYPAKIDMWRPTHFDPLGWKSYRGDGTRFVNVFARLKPGVTLANAQSELRLIGTQLANEHPESDALWQFTSLSLRDDMYGELKPALLVLMTASAVLLLIACLNVGNLLLSRATSRQREVALRQALGASRIRILRQLLTESTLLACIGGVVGLGAAYTLVRVAGAKLPPVLQAQGAITLDWPVVAFALIVSICAGVVFGLAPALQNWGGDMNRSLKNGESRVAGAAGSRLRSGFIAVQVGLSLVLLVSACLLVQSLWKLTKSPLGFRPDHVLTFQIELPWDSKTERTDNFFSDVQRSVEELPGVTAVGQISALPTVNWHLRSSYDVDWKPRTPHQDTVNAEDRHLSGNYLKAMNIPLLAGRELRSNDGAVVLINKEFARRYMPDGNPVGKHLINQHSLEIVGVIGDVRGTAGSIAGEMQPEVYFPAGGITSRSFVVRSALPPEQLITAIRSQVRRVDPQQAVGNERTLDEMLSVAVAQPRLNMALVVSFAGIALLLACVGIYGVVAYSVAQRRQEIGVRMALGATRGQISMLFLRRTIAAALIGLACGGVASLLSTRLLRSQLYGVQPNNPMTFLIAILLLLTPVFVASLRPALQAASVDPVEALRTE
jgi:putative ABC transport system permease protein